MLTHECVLPSSNPLLYRIDTVQKLAVALADLDEIVLSTSKNDPKQPKNPPYAKDRLLAQYPDPKASFSKLYHFLFNLCRVEYVTPIPRRSDQD